MPEQRDLTDLKLKTGPQKTIVLSHREILLIERVPGTVLRNPGCECRMREYRVVRIEDPWKPDGWGSERWTPAPPTEIHETRYSVVQCHWCRILKRHGLRFPATFWHDKCRQQIEITGTIL